MANPADSAGATTQSVEAWLAQVLDAERRGELLAGFDLASRGLEEHPGDPVLRYRAVLALARTGSTGEAARQFDELDLGSIQTEDVAALRARIHKDEALAADGDECRRLALATAEDYRSIRAATGGYYPAINAATLTLLGGDVEGARQLAADALALVATSGEVSYYSAATEAEAHLVMGDREAAAEALQRAAAQHGGDFGALSTTRRQLRLVCRLTGTDPSLLTLLAGPAVAHFCGHRMAGAHEAARFAPEQEVLVAAAMGRILDTRPIGAAYGSLASGADILWAEALLQRGAELHVVLPFALDEFLAVSVAPAGARWVQRCTACLDRASSVTWVTEDAYLGDDSLFRYCTDNAMGLALLRARFLDAEAFQLAVWDGEAADGPAGTAADIALWEATGHPLVALSPDGAVQPVPVPALGQAGSSGEASEGRVVRAMLMGDVRAFSKLRDQQLPAFSREVLGAFAEVLDRFGDHVEYANTWGDAFFAVFATASIAARCALAIQERLARIDLAAAGLPEHLALRLSGHVGPVFPIVDPVLKRHSFIGAHVSRTARIEPVTPTGAVYVTEVFAAALELAGASDVRCDYVGHLPTAKDYGKLRMYRVRRPAGTGARAVGAS